jgi:hypothetical protein
MGRRGMGGRRTGEGGGGGGLLGEGGEEWSFMAGLVGCIAALGGEEVVEHGEAGAEGLLEQKKKRGRQRRRAALLLLLA